MDGSLHGCTWVCNCGLAQLVHELTLTSLISMCKAEFSVAEDIVEKDGIERQPVVGPCTEAIHRVMIGKFVDLQWKKASHADTKMAMRGQQLTTLSNQFGKK